MKYLLFVLTLAGTGLAQNPAPNIPRPDFPPALRLFLDLSEEQVRMIKDLNEGYNRFAVEKARRVRQVQWEIGQVTKQEVLDPMALGVRYVEIEAIRRQLRAERERLRQNLRAGLSDDQNTRLGALEQAMALEPVYKQAVGVGLLEGPGLWINTTTFLRYPFQREAEAQQQQ